MKKTPIITACLMSVLVFSSSLLAQESSDDNLISAEAALEKAIQAQPATYTTIELLPGKDSRMLYLAEGEKDGRPVLTVVDASTGKELSPAMKDGDKSLTEAIQAAGNAFSGKVISASKEFMPYYETIYTVVIKQDAQELYLPALEDQQQRLHIDISDQKEVIGNSDLLFQVLCNLLDNAGKYSPPQSTILIKSKLNTNVVSLTICDQGGGVDDSALPQLCEKFYRLDSSRHHCGNGLGLSFVKAAIERMQGYIDIENCCTQGRPGLAVSINLPVSDALRKK